MTTEQNSLARADDQKLTEFINQTKQRLVVIAPGLRDPVARAVAEKWQALGPANVTVTLDTDPEIVRIGVGTVSALELLEKTAQHLGTVLRRQSGIGIGIVVCDNHTLVFSPTPPIMAADGFPARTNALFLNGAAFAPLNDATSSKADSIFSDETRIGLALIAKMKEDLANNPPQPVAAAEKIRVFNAFFEFVELKLEGTAIERRTVPIPNELLGLAHNDDLRERMRTSFRLVGDEHRENLSGRELDEVKKRIIAKYLNPLKGYGNAVLRSLKPEFEQEVKDLQKKVDAFKKTVEEYLQKAIDRNCEELKTLLLPGVKKSPLSRWNRFGPLDDATIGRLLEDELKKAFGTAKHHIGEMKVTCIFKGVTYELLSDAKFIGVATQAIPTFPTLHREFDAVEMV